MSTENAPAPPFSSSSSFSKRLLSGSSLSYALRVATPAGMNGSRLTPSRATGTATRTLLATFSTRFVFSLLSTR